MSSYLDHLPIGAQIEVRGPKGAFAYSPALAPYMLLVAGGSGITPMYRIIKSAALDPTDTTRMALLWANVAEEDIRESGKGEGGGGKSVPRTGTGRGRREEREETGA